MRALSKLGSAARGADRNAPGGCLPAPLAPLLALSPRPSHVNVRLLSPNDSTRSLTSQQKTETKLGRPPPGPWFDYPLYLPFPGVRLRLPVREALLREHRPIGVRSPAQGEEPVSFRDGFPANQRRLGLGRAPRLPGAAGGAAPGGGESLRRAAAASSSRGARGRRAGQWGAGGGPARGGARSRVRPGRRCAEPSLCRAAAAALAPGSCSPWGQRRESGGDGCSCSLRRPCVSGRSPGGSRGVGPAAGARRPRAPPAEGRGSGPARAPGPPRRSPTPRAVPAALAPAGPHTRPPARPPRAAGPAHGADAGGPSPRTWGGSPRPGAARVRRSRQEPCARRRLPGLLAAAPAGAPESLMEGRGRLSLAVAGEVSLLPRNLGGGGCPGKRVRVQSLKKYN